MMSAIRPRQIFYNVISAVEGFLPARGTVLQIAVNVGRQLGGKMAVPSPAGQLQSSLRRVHLCKERGYQLPAQSAAAEKEVSFRPQA